MKKIVILYCKTCNRVKHFDVWVIPSPEIKRQIQELRIDGYIKFVKSTCDVCSKAVKA